MHNVQPGDLFSNTYPKMNELLAASSIYLSSALAEGIEHAPSTMDAISYINKFKVTPAFLPVGLCLRWAVGGGLSEQEGAGWTSR